MDYGWAFKAGAHSVLTVDRQHVPTVVVAQSVTEARFALEDIAEWLPGTYDNASQVYLDASFGAGDDGNHPWLRLEIEAIGNTGLGEAVYLVRTHYRDDDDAAPSLRLLAFSVDEPLRAVRMESYNLPPGTTMGPDVRPESAALIEEGCPVYWRQGPDYLYGAMPGNWCEVTENGQTSLRKANVSLTADELLIERASKDGDTGALVAGRADELPLKFKKVTAYECYIVVNHVSDDGLTIINPFFVDDGGGQYFFETKESPPRQMEIFLRKSLHASNSGENFLPMVHMFLYPDGTKDRLASSWAHEDSGIVGWATPGVGAAGCKLTTLAPERGP